MEEDFEDGLYDEFPRGDENEAGPLEGFNTWVRVNDEAWFTDAARENPAIRQFLDAPFTVNFAQFKSSHRETEYWLHKPYQAMNGEVDGIVGTVENFRDGSQIGTYIVNHELTLARYITRTLVVQDKHAPVTGQIVHKEVEPSE